MPQPVPIVDVQVDACNLASGAFFRGDWLYVNFKNDHPQAASLHINHKETLSLLYAARRWAPMWANSKLVLHSDNTTAVCTINRMSSKNPVVMEGLRELFWLSAKHNFQIHAVYLPGILNQMADCISRLHQPGQLAYLNSQLNHSLHPNLLHFHTSSKSLSFLSPQILRWTRSRPSLTPRWPHTVARPSLPPQNLLTSHISRPTSSFVNSWAAHPSLFPP